MTDPAEKYTARIISPEEAQDLESFRKIKSQIKKRFFMLERQKVSCPWCYVGYAMIDIHKYPDGTNNVENFNEPRRCVSCKKYIKLKATMHISGERIS